MALHYADRNPEGVVESFNPQEGDPLHPIYIRLDCFVICINTPKLSLIVRTSFMYLMSKQKTVERVDGWIVYFRNRNNSFIHSSNETSHLTSKKRAAHFSNECNEITKGRRVVSAMGVLVTHK